MNNIDYYRSANPSNDGTGEVWFYDEDSDNYNPLDDDDDDDYNPFDDDADDEYYDDDIETEEDDSSDDEGGY